MSKLVYYGDNARQKLKQGVDFVVNSVKVTMGAKGRNVIIGNQFGSPTATKDGVTVSKAISHPDPAVNQGVLLVQEVAHKTVTATADGTTQSCVLTQALVNAGLKNVASGANPMDLKRGMEKALSHIVTKLKTISIPVKGDAVLNVATISANGEKAIGELVAEAIEKVGFDGLVTMEESHTAETHISFLEGMQFETGLMSVYFSTTPTLEAEINNPLIMLCDRKIESFNDVIAAMEICVNQNRELLLIAEDVDLSVIAALINNRRQPNGLRVTTVRAPGFGETRSNFLQDLAVVTGATVISEDLNMKPSDVTLEMLGGADKVWCDKDNTSIIGGKGKASGIKDRISTIKALIKNEKEDHILRKLKSRLSKLAGGVATIYVGAATDVEMREKKDRVDDALGAVRAAIAEGIVPGGGVALIRAIEDLNKISCENEDEKLGVKIVQTACQTPIKQILDNAGVNSALIIGKIMESKKDLGYNVKTDEYENFLTTGVIDPAKVIRVALEYSVSIASMIITTESLIVDREKTNEPEVTNNVGGLF